MITRPPIFTSIDDKEVDYKKPVSEELVLKMVRNCNLLGELAKIGSIRAFQLNLENVNPPNPDIWQLCNNTEIIQIDSPLKTVVPTSRFTPDMTSRYVRGAPDELTNATGGSPTVNLSHTHTIDVVCASVAGEEGNERNAYENNICHTHTVTSNLNAAEPLEMAHLQVAFYLKIN